MNTKLIGVNPVIKCLVNIGLEICKRQGINAYVVEGKRSLSRQKELYGKGRTYSQCKSVMPDSDAKKYAKPSEKQVTWTMKSKHLEGLAVDIVPYKKVNGKIELIWNTSDKNYQKISKIFKSLGFEWGGNWTSTPDYPHYQISTIRQEWKTISKERQQKDVVRCVQKALQDKGYFTGNISGDWTLTFINAIYKFKADNGLTKNKIITKTFLKKLYL